MIFIIINLVTNLSSPTSAPPCLFVAMSNICDYHQFEQFDKQSSSSSSTVIMSLFLTTCWLTVIILSFYFLYQLLIRTVLANTEYYQINVATSVQKKILFAALTNCNRFRHLYDPNRYQLTISSATEMSYNNNNNKSPLTLISVTNSESCA